MDVHAIDVDGRHIDIEVQINAEGSHVKRARYHSSMMDARMLEEGQEFKEIKDSYVIFIYDHDKFRKGLPFITFKGVLMKRVKPLEMVRILSM